MMKIKIIDYKLISYEDLHLYTVAFYSKTVSMIKNFVCSDIGNDTIADNDFIVELNGEFDNNLKKYNVKIDGLDYLLNDFELEILNHLNKVEVVSYKDKK